MDIDDGNANEYSKGYYKEMAVDITLNEQLIFCDTKIESQSKIGTANFYTNAKEQDYASFYQTEIQSREDFDYPPFSKIIRIILSSKNQFRAERSAQEIAMRLNDVVDKHQISEPLAVLGPCPCVIERLQEWYRFQILVKNKLDEKGHRFVLNFLNQIKLPDDIKLTVDVDPLDIL